MKIRRCGKGLGAAFALALLASAGTARADVASAGAFTLAGSWSSGTATSTPPAVLSSPNPVTPSGTGRILVVAVVMKANGVLNDAISYTVTAKYNTTVDVLPMASTGAPSSTSATAAWVGYVMDPNLVATLSSAQVSVTVASKGATGFTAIAVYTGFFTGANVGTPSWTVADSSTVNVTGNIATVPEAVNYPATGAMLAVVAAPTAATAPSVSTSGYTLLGSGTAPLGAYIGWKATASASSETTVASGTGPLAFTAISLNPANYVGVGDGTPFSTAPMVAIMNPMDGQAISRATTGFRVQARVFSPKNAALATQLIPVGGVVLLENGVQVATLGQLSAYGGATNESGIWEVKYNPVGGDGAQRKLQVQATNATGSVRSRAVYVSTTPQGTGDSKLLVRDNASQLCNDCHNLPIHSSEKSGNRLGSWAVVCRDCHTPHATTNVYLVQQTVKPPPITRDDGSHNVVFTTTARGAANSLLNTGASATGPCQACHNRTTDSVGNPLFRNSITADTSHNTTTPDCMACHGHTSGFPRPVLASCHECHGKATPRADLMPTETVPPIDTCGNTVATTNLGGSNRVGAHVAHLLGSKYQYGLPGICTSCHLSDVNGVASPPPGHPGAVCSTLQADRAVFTFGPIATGTGGTGTVWAGTTTPAYNYSTQGCSAVYCHGAWPDPNKHSGYGAAGATPTWGQSITTCSACHYGRDITTSAPTWPHPFRASDLVGSTCTSCHPGSSTPPTKTSTTHVDGNLDKTTSGCTQCHGALLLTASNAAPLNAAPGVTTVAVDVTGLTTTTSGATGAHFSHLVKTNFRSTTLACIECHAVPPDGDTNHATASTTGSRATLTWGTLAKGTVQGWTPTTANPGYSGSNTQTYTSPSYGTTGGTCATVFCHGAFPNGPNSGNGNTVAWNGGISYSATVCTSIPCATSKLTCTSCHGSGTDAQPATAHTAGNTGWGCGGCHGAAYGWNGASGTVDRTLHMNGKVDGGAGGPDCLGCHNAPKGNRRNVLADFSKYSHHVRGTMAGGTAADATTVGNNFDCVVCHMEGQILAANATSQDCATPVAYPSTCTNHSYHNNKKIDLRDVDVAAPAADQLGTAFTYDVDTIGTVNKPASWSSIGGQANWVAQQQIMDSFCVNCHDANGANQISTFRATTSRTNVNPFWDDLITNSYDAKDRTGMVNVKDMVVSGLTDLDKSTEPRGNTAGVFDPPNGIYSRHAINGKSLSPYKTIGGIPSANWVAGWNDMSVMSCADCHTNDGANGTTGNAHGSGSDYLLKDGSGGATRGTTGTTYVCARCHAGTIYSADRNHDGSGSNFADGRTGNGSVFGIACLNCHGGAPGDYGTSQTGPGGAAESTNAGFGRIHGTSSIFRTQNATASTYRYAYRFMNGGALRYFDPGTWNTASTNCYTIGTADSWSGCTQHTGAAGLTTPVVRNIQY